MTYASWKATSRDGVIEYLDGIGPIYDLVSYSSTHLVALNYSVDPEALGILDNARVEYYHLRVYSDKGQIENMTVFLGANCEDYVERAPTKSFFFARPGWFNTTTSGGGTFISNLNETLASSLANGLGLSATSSIHSSNSFKNTTLPQEFLNIQNANTLYIDVRRLGYVTFDGNSTIVTLASDQVIQHIELTRNGDQFIYGMLPQSMESWNLTPQNPAIPEQNP